MEALARSLGLLMVSPVFFSALCCLIRLLRVFNVLLIHLLAGVSLHRTPDTGFR